MSRAHQLLQQVAPEKPATNEARKAYFDDDAELYDLSDREIDRVTKTRAGYPMELVGDDSAAMQEYVDEHPEGIVVKGGRRLSVTMTSDALAKFLKAARDGELSDDLEDLASSVAETMKSYMDESMDEALVDEDGEYNLAVMLLVNAAKAGGYRKVGNALTREHKAIVKEPIELSDLHAYFEDINYEAYAMIASGIERKLDEWRLKALLDVQKLHDKRGAGGMDISTLRLALAGTKKSQDFFKAKTYPTPVGADLVKLIKKLPEEFQQELANDYDLTF